MALVVFVVVVGMVVVVVCRKARIRKCRLALRDSRPIVSLLTALLILSPDAQAAQFQPGFNAHDAAGARNLDLFLLLLAGLPG